MAGWKKRLKEDSISALVLQAVVWAINALTPWVLSIVTLISPFFQPQIDVPVAYVITAATIVFAASVTGLLRFDEWRQRRTPSDKLGLADAMMIFDHKKDRTTGKVTGIEHAQAGLLFENSATFPLSYIMEEISSSIEGTINPGEKKLNRGMVGPKSILHYRDERIDTAAFPAKERLEAKLKFKLKFGRPGRENYVIQRNISISCILDENTGYQKQVKADITD